jgi:hypothetical protein
MRAFSVGVMVKRAKLFGSATFFTVNRPGVRLITFPAIIRTTIFKASGGCRERGFLQALG